MSQDEKIKKLLKKAQGHLDQHDYSASLKDVAEILALDPKNTQAKKLQKTASMELANASSAISDDLDDAFGDNFGLSFASGGESPNDLTAGIDLDNIADEADPFGLDFDLDEIGSKPAKGGKKDKGKAGKSKTPAPAPDLEATLMADEDLDFDLGGGVGEDEEPLGFGGIEDDILDEAPSKSKKHPLADMNATDVHNLDFDLGTGDEDEGLDLESSKTMMESGGFSFDEPDDIEDADVPDDDFGAGLGFDDDHLLGEGSSSKGQETFVGASPIDPDDTAFGEGFDSDLGGVEEDAEFLSDGFDQHPAFDAEDDPQKTGKLRVSKSQPSVEEDFDFDSFEENAGAIGNEGDEFDFQSADAFPDSVPMDDSLGFNESITDDSIGGGAPGETMDEGFDIADDFDLGGTEREADTIGFDSSSRKQEEEDFLAGTLQEDISAFMGEDGASDGYYQDFGLQDAGEFDFEKESAEEDTSLSGKDLNTVKDLWTRGAEKFRQRDYAGCIQLMERILQLDPGNDSAKGYIEMAREKLAGAQKSTKGYSQDDPSVDLSAELLDDEFAAGLGESPRASSLADDFLTDDTLSPANPYSRDLGSAFADPSDDDALFDTLMKPLNQAAPNIADLAGSSAMDDDFSEDALSRSFITEPIIGEDAELPVMKKNLQTKPKVRAPSSATAMMAGMVVVMIVVVAGGGFYAYNSGLLESIIARPTPPPTPRPVVDVLDGPLAAQYQEAIALYNGAKFEQAKAILEQIENKQPGNKEVTEQLALINEMMRRMQNSEEEKEKLQKISALYTEGEQLFKDGKFTDAQLKMNEVLQIQPENQGAIYFLQKCQEEIKRSREEEARKAEQTTLMAAAQEAVDKKEYAHAVNILNQVLDIAPDFEDAKKLRERASTELANQKLSQINQLLDSGKEHWDYDRYASCIETMREVLALDSANSTARSFIEMSQQKLKIASGLDEAQTYFDAGRYDEALKAVDSVLATEPNNARAKELKGWAQTALDDMRSRGLTTK